MHLRTTVARIAADPKILDERDPHKLHGLNFDPPLPPALTADCRQVLRHFAVPDGVPVFIRQLRADTTGTGVAHSILEVVYLENCLPNVGDRVGDNSIKADTFTVRSRGRQSGKPFGSRLYILVQYRIKVKRDDPVKPRTQVALVDPKTQQDSLLVVGDNDKWDARGPDRLKDFKELF